MSEIPFQKPNRVLDLDTTYVLIALAPIVLRALIMPIAPNDFWWHMAHGRLIWNTGKVPVVDHFSYTQNGAPFYNQSWLSQLWFYGLQQLGGVPLVLVGQAFCVAFAYGLLLWLCIKRTDKKRLCVGLLLAGVMPMSFDNWQVRPQTFALPFFAAYLCILSAYRLRWGNYLWALPLLMAFWVNLHGSFEQGLALIVLALIGEGIRRKRGDDQALTASQWRALLGWGALSLAATLLNPRGINIYFYVHDVLRHPSTQFSSEWAAPSFKQFTDVYFFLYVIVLAVALSKARPRPPLTDWLIVLPFLLVAFISGRSIMWFGLVSLPLFALALSSLAKAPSNVESTGKQLNERSATLMNGVVVLVVWLMVLLTLPWIKPALGLPPQLGSVVDPQTPVKMTAALRALPPDERPKRLFHSEAFGSYLIWGAPEQKVFIDPRFELYPPQQWRNFNDLKRGLRVPELLHTYRFDGLMLDKKEHKNLIAKVKATGRWKVACERPGAVLMVKNHR
jgi:hypothetical protein